MKPNSPARQAILNEFLDRCDEANDEMQRTLLEIEEQASREQNEAYQDCQFAIKWAKDERDKALIELGPEEDYYYPSAPPASHPINKD